MKSLVKFLEEDLFATPLNTTGMGAVQGFESDPMNTDLILKRKNKIKKRLKKKS